MKRVFPIVFVFTGLPLYALESAVENAPTIQLDALVVTGTRSQKIVSDTPVRTEVITKEQLQKRHIKTVAEALKGISSLTLKPIHGKNGIEVWMQGFSSDRVKILVDGLPISATTGSSVDVTQLSTVGVERIEIVKGATSSLYGSSAMGGVINVITRRSSSDDFNDASDLDTKYAVSLETGSYGDDNPSGKKVDSVFRRVSAVGSGRIGAWEVSLSADVSDTDGFDVTPNDWDSQGARGTRSTFGLDVSWDKASFGQYSFGLEHYAEDLASNLQENAGGKVINKLKTEDTSRIRFDSAAQWELDEGSLSASIIRETLENTTYQDVVSTPEKEQRREANLDFNQVNLDWITNAYEEHTINLGAQFFSESLSQKKENLYEVSPNTERNSVELYIQDDFFYKNWEFLPGVRVQDDSDFGFYTAPKMNVRYDFDSRSQRRTYLRAGVGAGYRVPNLKERYFLFDHSHLGYVVNGNDALVPEESLSYQIGLGIENGQAQSYGVNLFLNRIDNLIVTGLDEKSTAERLDNVQVFRYQNAEKARTYGAEFNLQQQLSSNVQLQVGYTWMQSEDLKTGKPLTRRPDHQINLSLDAELPQWDSQVSLLGRYQSSEYVDEQATRRSPSWSEFDVKINKSVSKEFTLFAGVNNVTDTQKDFYKGGDFRPEVGRYIYVGFSLSD
ncbi:TonB-dependent receptor plug domain-containing protein [Marinomonas sp. 2405UD68-3]|uniref:TonB-dependent receptor plug domain-containing protein n=1 Tax=Marinomonas sp. 2405UD68-3 TaxID=3391835 RepID=UPI0039C94370